jgi:sugar lactone lactonase YvrE
MNRSTTPLVDGLAFGEGPRWHDGRLWFSDMYDHRVKAVDPAGKLEDVVEIQPGKPSGLGFREDGTLLIVSMDDRRLLAYDGSRTTEVADLSAAAPADCNDMAVDADGRAYVGNFGVLEGKVRRPTTLVVVDPDGAARVAADGMHFPNGIAITEDGTTLVVAETTAHRLTAFSIGPAGELGDRRVLAQFEERIRPDGICVDADDGVWLATVNPEVIRVDRNGEVTDTIPTGNKAFACMLGGDDRRTLFVCTAAPEYDHMEDTRSGAIETVEVEIPGAGRP